MRGQLSEYYFFLEKKNAFEVIIWLFRSLALPLSENQNSQCYLCPLLGWPLHWNTSFGNSSKGRLQNPQWYCLWEKKIIPQE